MIIWIFGAAIIHRTADAFITGGTYSGGGLIGPVSSSRGGGVCRNPSTYLDRRREDDDGIYGIKGERRRGGSASSLAAAATTTGGQSWERGRGGMADLGESHIIIIVIHHAYTIIMKDRLGGRSDR